MFLVRFCPNAAIVDVQRIRKHSVVCLEIGGPRYCLFDDMTRIGFLLFAASWAAEVIFFEVYFLFDQSYEYTEITLV